MRPGLKIGIVGIGAIGSVVSFSLNEGCEIFYFNRSPKSKLSVELNGTRKTKTIALSTSQHTPPLDWLIICLKEYHIQGALETIKNLVHPNLNIALFQNGLALKTLYGKLTTPDKIVECIIDCPTEFIEEGCYLQRSRLAIILNGNENNYEFDLLFNKAVTSINKASNFHSAKWQKLIESSALGGILCLADDTCRIFQNEKMVHLYESVLDEAVQVAIADGAAISSSYKAEMVNKLLRYPYSKTSSMLLDQRNGKPIEINAKNGVISHLGKKHNIPTPLHDLICTLLSHPH